MNRDSKLHADPGRLSNATRLLATSIDAALTRSYLTALLLTGDVVGAEAAVMEGIQSVDLNQELSDTLLWATVESALRQPPVPGWETSRPSEGALPFELQRVLRLPWQLRRCYVLRVLVGLPRRRCAALLDLDLRAADNSLWDALRTLAAVKAA